MKPIKFLKGTLGTLIQSGTTTVNGTTGVANAWTANLTAINPQAHNDSTTPRPMTYNGLDINVGDWIVSTGEENSKQATMIQMLKRAEGASISQICEATGWQAHSVRGAFSAAFKKKLGLTITSIKSESGSRVYKLTV